MQTHSARQEREKILESHVYLLNCVGCVECGHGKVVEDGVQDTDTKPCAQHRQHRKVHKLKADDDLAQKVVVAVCPHAQPVGQCVDQRKKCTIEPTTALLE